MTNKTEQQATPPPPPTAKETEIPTDVTGADATPADVAPLDPKEEARQRSKADLQRKRHNLRNKHGKI